MNRDPLLHVSPIMYSHPQTAPIHTVVVQFMYINKFITNKLHNSMKRKPHLHVSAIIYTHLQGVNLVYVFQYILVLPEDGYKQ
jgi:hypothetical protein